MANRMIIEGVIEGANLLSCEKWDRAAELVQCFNCHGYGHITSRCSQPTRCGTCAGSHSSRDHEQVAMGSEKTTKKCVLCNKDGHTAWEPLCKVRIREKQRKLQKLANKSKLYSAKANREVKETPKIFTDAEGFCLIQSSRKKRKAPETNEKEDQLPTPIARPSTKDQTTKIGRPRKFATIETGQQSLTQMI